MNETFNSAFGSRCPPQPDPDPLDPSVTKTVLVVDDNQDDVFLLGDAISSVISGCRLLSVADGVEAEDLLKRMEGDQESGLPFVIFTDVNMPRHNGFQLLEWVKQRPRCAGIPVVMVSTFDNPADLERARELGAAACLRKPPKPEEAQRLTASIMYGNHENSHPRSRETLVNRRIRPESRGQSQQRAKRIQLEDDSQAYMKTLPGDADEQQNKKAISQHR
jgi:CheY-like chemotaxis protein